jgi:hypothetical protein
LNDKQNQNKSFISNKSQISAKSHRTSKSIRSLRSYNKSPTSAKKGQKSASIKSMSEHKSRSASRRSKSTLNNILTNSRTDVTIKQIPIIRTELQNSFEEQAASVHEKLGVHQPAATSITGSINDVRVDGVLDPTDLRRSRSPLSDDSPNRAAIRRRGPKQSRDSFMQDFRPIGLLHAQHREDFDKDTARYINSS